MQEVASSFPFPVNKQLHATASHWVALFQIQSSFLWLKIQNNAYIIVSSYITEMTLRSTFIINYIRIQKKKKIIIIQIYFAGTFCWVKNQDLKTSHVGVSEDYDSPLLSCFFLFLSLIKKMPNFLIDIMLIYINVYTVACVKLVLRDSRWSW